MFKLVQTCGACPEQYDVFDDGYRVGYLRLRYGCFRADFGHCGGETIYQAYTKGDGIFTEDEREYHLNEACKAIKNKLANSQQEQLYYIEEENEVNQ